MEMNGYRAPAAIRDAIGRAFVEKYYSTFDSNPAGLADFYQESSLMTFNGLKIQGSRNIVAKLTSPQFKQCKHSVITVDCQRTGPSGSVVFFVSGNLQLSGEPHPLTFTQIFHLMHTTQSSGSYFVNDIFRFHNV
ncbi:nuclear transport factor 2A-like [Rutidosis leptorrhynchoides]|uniref:nuclear transport factor 2A-like n=1 Tax=Rutidosis leptorrhynchoides TaxID=125765 RepID=UPI003A996E6B